VVTYANKYSQKNLLLVAIYNEGPLVEHKKPSHIREMSLETKGLVKRINPFLHPTAIRLGVKKYVVT